MTPEDRLRAALRTAAGPAGPDRSGADRVLADAAHRRRRRATTLSSLAVAVLLAIGGAAVVRDDDGSSEVDTRPAQTTTTTAPAAPDTAVAVTSEGAVVVVDTADGRVARTLAPAGSASPDQKAARTPDGRSVWFAERGVDCGFDTLYEVSFFGDSAPKRVGRGLSPSFSPNGAFVAYTDGDGCVSPLLTVRDLATGTERYWRPAPGSKHVFTTGGLRAVDWAPDSRRVAVQFDGGGVWVLDTLVPAVLDVADPVEPDLDPLQSMLGVPAWKPDDGRLAVGVGCCRFPDGMTEEQVEAGLRTILVDPATDEWTELLPAGRVVLSLDYDESGRWLLWVDEDGTLQARHADGHTRRFGTGFATATW